MAAAKDCDSRWNRNVTLRVAGKLWKLFADAVIFVVA
jgi:hypothetical protein